MLLLMKISRKNLYIFNFNKFKQTFKNPFNQRDIKLSITSNLGLKTQKKTLFFQ